MTPLMSGMLLCVLVLTVVLLLAYGQLKQVEEATRRRTLNRHLEWEPLLATLRPLPPSAQELEATTRVRYLRRSERRFEKSRQEKLPDALSGSELPWWASAALMERQGYAPEQIATALEIPAAEVQLVLALGYPSRSC